MKIMVSLKTKLAGSSDYVNIEITEEDVKKLAIEKTMDQYGVDSCEVLNIATTHIT